MSQLKFVTLELSEAEQQRMLAELYQTRKAVALFDQTGKLVDLKTESTASVNKDFVFGSERGGTVLWPTC